MRVRNALKWSAVVLAGGISLGAALRVTRVGAPFQIRGPLHSVTHIGLFGVLTLLLMGCTRSWRLRWVLCFGAFLLGLGTEYYEGVRDHGGIETADVMADGLGIALAALLMVGSRFLSRRQQRSM